MSEDAKAILAQALLDEGALWKPTVESTTFGRLSKKARARTRTLFLLRCSRKGDDSPRYVFVSSKWPKPNVLRDVSWRKYPKPHRCLFGDLLCP